MKSLNLFFIILMKLCLVELSLERKIILRSTKVPTSSQDEDGPRNAFAKDNEDGPRDAFAKDMVNTIFRGKVNKDTTVQRKFGIVSEPSYAVRVFTKTHDATLEGPLFVVIQRPKQLVSWTIPMTMKTYNKENATYHETERTLCPLDDMSDTDNISTTDLEITLSTSSTKNISYELRIYLEDFLLKLDRDGTGKNSKLTNISTTKPRFYKLDMTSLDLKENEDQVLLQVTSENDTCMTLSVQDSNCPVYDQNSNVKFVGIFQTVNRTGAMWLSKEQRKGSNYVVLVAHPDDSECQINPYSLWNPTLLNGNMMTSTTENRQKLINITISGTLSAGAFRDNILGTVLFFVVFAIVAMVVLAGYTTLYKTRMSTPDTTTQNTKGIKNLVPKLEEGRGSEVSTKFKRADTRVVKYSALYLKGLWIVALFYGIPVIQLVLTYERTTNQSGNKDQCYFNFKCAHALIGKDKTYLTDFNHVLSNVGYVVLGILSIVCIFIHKKWTMLKLTSIADTPDSTDDAFQSYYRDQSIQSQQYGLYYTLASALIMQGIMSSCYHVCPNNINFQFDTFFMFTIAILVMVTIYNRMNPWQTISVFTVYGILAAILFMAILGILWDAQYQLSGETSDSPFVYRAITSTIKMGICPFLSYLCYTDSRIKLDFIGLKRFIQAIFGRIFGFLNLQHGEIKAFFTPDKPQRMLLLILWNIMNLALVLTTTISYRSLTFLESMLFRLTVNTLFFIALYIGLKWANKEHITKTTLACMIMSMLTWAPALWLFSQKRNSFESSPANSRENNMPCIIGEFYDEHDLWHFFSSLGLFLNLMILLTLDDDLITKPTDENNDFRVTKADPGPRPITIFGENA